MDRLQAARVFIEIVDQGSMIAAAERLNMSRSKVSRYLQEIEHWANARLLHRSTRRLSLTNSGEKVLLHCRRLLEVADDIPLSTPQQGQPVSGHLRISCAHYAADHILLPVLERYQQDYPRVSVDLQISNTSVDLIANRIDLAIRIASRLDPNLIARKLGECDSVLCASPSYLRQHGTPRTLPDLQRHKCLIYSHFERHDLWRFSHAGEPCVQPVSGDLISGDSQILLKAALRHMGISYQPRADVQPYLESGQLIEILTPYQPLTLNVYAVYLSRKNMPPALRQLLNRLGDN